MGATKKEGGKQKAMSDTHFGRECRFHLILPLLVFVLSMTQASIQRKLMLPSRYYDGTVLIKAIESDTVHIFQKAVFPLLTYLMSFSYLVIYICAIIFTTIVLAYYRQTILFKRFALMFSLNYLIAFPFFMLFHVSIAGASLQNVRPLLYEQFPRIYSIITDIDPLDNCFPSLHVAMVLSAFLIMQETNFKRYKTFLAVGFPIIVFSVLYLGIHWITDVFAGIGLAFFTYYVAKSVYKQPPVPQM